MKLLICSFLLAFSSVAFSCPDFSGSYIKNSDGTPLDIYQEACNKIAYVFEGGKKASFIIDGKVRLFATFDLGGSDGGSYATVKIYQSKAFKGLKLFTTGRSETHYTDTGKLEIQKSTSLTYFDADKNLIVDSTLQDGSHQQEAYIKNN